MSHEIEKRVLEEIFRSSEAHQNLLVLADDIGARLAGSENEIQTRDFLVETLELDAGRRGGRLRKGTSIGRQFGREYR